MLRESWWLFLWLAVYVPVFLFNNTRSNETKDIEPKVVRHVKHMANSVSEGRRRKQ
jgi:hypothetical protein